MKAKKALKRLNKVETILSNVIDQCPASSRGLRELLESAKQAQNRQQRCLFLPDNCLFLGLIFVEIRQMPVVRLLAGSPQGVVAWRYPAAYKLRSRANCCFPSGLIALAALKNYWMSNLPRRKSAHRASPVSRNKFEWPGRPKLRLAAHTSTT